MEENKNNSFNLKIFFIKLLSVAIVVVIVINLIFNLIFADRLEKIDKILLLNQSAVREEVKEKIRRELNDGLDNEHLLAEEDKILLYKIYMKLRKEFEVIDKKQTTN